MILLIQIFGQVPIITGGGGEGGGVLVPIKLQTDKR